MSDIAVLIELHAIDMFSRVHVLLSNVSIICFCFVDHFQIVSKIIPGRRTTFDRFTCIHEYQTWYNRYVSCLRVHICIIDVFIDLTKGIENVFLTFACRILVHGR
jgi:hypothetical protein